MPQTPAATATVDLLSSLLHSLPALQIRNPNVMD